MRERVFVIVIIMNLSIGLQAVHSFTWPVDEPVVISTFGENKWGNFRCGIELAGESVDVRPSDDGEVIYCEDEDSPSVLPGGMGNFMVIEHKRKLRSLYASIEFSKSPDEYKSVTTSDIIGRTGSSGKSVNPHLFFAVIDSEFEQFVNPLLLLNTIADSRAPVIEEVGILTSEGFLPLSRKNIVNTCDAEILARIWDPCISSDYKSRMAPYKIHLFLNGEEIFYINFESMRFESGEAVIQAQDEITYSDYYRKDDFISLGTIKMGHGDFRFEILADDYSGNETARSFRITVMEQ